MAGGNNIATYSGDASHHLYLAGNLYRQAYLLRGRCVHDKSHNLHNFGSKLCVQIPRSRYGNDRETMTFDDFGSAYYGRFSGLETQADGTSILRTPGGTDQQHHFGDSRLKMLAKHPWFMMLLH